VTLFLQIHAPDAEAYNLDFIDLEDAIKAEARTIADDADAELLEAPTVEERDRLEAEVIAAASAVLHEAGDAYVDPTGVRWSLEEVPE
jgi:hypothetical protein